MCQCCGSYENLEYDHISPYSCGGNSDASNIQLLCQKCNRSKSNSCYCKVHDKKVGINCCEGTTTNSNQSSTMALQCSGQQKKRQDVKTRQRIQVDVVITIKNQKIK
jgi:hypothetical protein